MNPRPGTSPTSPAAAAPLGAVARSITLLVLFVVGAGLYLPTLAFDFLSWDDKRYILNNPWVHGLTLENLTFVFTRPYFHNYLPFHLLSYQIDYALWGPRAAGFHLHSLLLHGVNGVLACLTLARLGSPWPVAAAASLLFAVHPSHVEAVAWISSRKDLLSLTFALLSLHAYRVSREGGASAARHYLISLGCYGIAILSKMTVVLLPLFFFLVDRLDFAVEARPARSGAWPALRGKIPFFVGALLASAVNYRVQVKATDLPANQPVEYLLVKGHAVWNYFLVLCGAAGGRPAYDLPQFGLRRPETYVALAGLLIAGLAAVAVAISWRRRVPAPLLGVGWTLVMIAPALAFPLVTYMADRYLYAPSLGFVWLLAAGVFAAAERVRKRGFRALVPAGLIGVFAALFIARTLQYLPVWKDSEALWSHVVAVSRSRLARNGLAVVRMNQQRYEEAEELLRDGTLAPDADTRRMLGILYDRRGRYPEALREYERGIALCRKPPGCGQELLGALHFNRGVTFWHLRDYRASALAYEEALRADPENAQARVWAEKARRLLR